jgi:hypothetical protein
MSDLSKKRRAENEKLFRDINDQLKRAVKRMVTPGEEDRVLMEFYCECADRGCQERINMTIQQFQAIENRHRLFVIKPGHAQPDIETVIDKHSKFLLVEKPQALTG